MGEEGGLRLHSAEWLPICRGMMLGIHSGVQAVCVWPGRSCVSHRHNSGKGVYGVNDRLCRWGVAAVRCQRNFPPFPASLWFSAMHPVEKLEGMILTPTPPYPFLGPPQLGGPEFGGVSTPYSEQ